MVRFCRKTIILTFIILLIFRFDSYTQNNSDDFGNVKVLYIHNIKQQLITALKESEKWSLKPYHHACLDPESGKLREQITDVLKNKSDLDLSFLMELKPPYTRACTRYYQAEGRWHTSKILAEKDKVYVKIIRPKKELAFVVYDSEHFIIQYFEGEENKLQFEIVYGPDYVIGMFYKDEKFYSTGNINNIKKEKAWKNYSPTNGMFPFSPADIGYFKVQTRIRIM